MSQTLRSKECAGVAFMFPIIDTETQLVVQDPEDQDIFDCAQPSYILIIRTHDLIPPG